MKSFKFLLQKMSQQNNENTDSIAGTSSGSNISQSQLSKYLCELEDDSTFNSSDMLNFWIQLENIYNKPA